MTSMKARRRRLGRLRAGFLLWSALIGATIAATAAQATIAAAPQSNSPPTISGQTREGRTLTALNGTWGNAPTSFAYQWQQCDALRRELQLDRRGDLEDLHGRAGDVDHQLRVAVTATNADGSASATSQPSGVDLVALGADQHRRTDDLRHREGRRGAQAPTGTWTGGVALRLPVAALRRERRLLSERRRRDRPRLRRPYGRCRQHAARRRDRDEPVGLDERDLGRDRPRSPATRPRRQAQPRADDHVRRAEAARRRASTHGSRSATTRAKAVTVIERDSMPGRLGYVRRFSVTPVPCGTHARNWKLIPRFHHQGRFTATLRAVDKSGASSRDRRPLAVLHRARLEAAHAPSAARLAERMRRQAEAGVRSAGLAAGDGELVLGVLDPLLDLPAVGGRLAALDRLELGLRGLELGAGAGVVDLRRPRRRRRRARSRGRRAPGRTRARSRTRARRRRHRDGSASSRPSASRSAARGARARRSRRSGRAR